MNKALRIKVWNKYNKHCAYCGNDLKYKDMQVDHLIPKARRYAYSNPVMKEHFKAKGDNINSFENLMPSCRRCNHYKRASSLEGFRRLIKTLHRRIQDIYINKVGIDYGIITIKEWDGLFYFEKTKFRRG